MCRRSASISYALAQASTSSSAGHVSISSPPLVLCRSRSFVPHVFDDSSVKTARSCRVLQRRRGPWLVRRTKRARVSCVTRRHGDALGARHGFHTRSSASSWEQRSWERSTERPARRRGVSSGHDGRTSQGIRRRRASVGRERAWRWRWRNVQVRQERWRI